MRDTLLYQTSGILMWKTVTSTRNIGAAIVCSLGIYIPIPGIRGAVFGSFPGVAQRSSTVIWKGVLWGAAADLIACYLWMWLGLAWEPRAGFNDTLNTYLPPVHMVVTHSPCPLPNQEQFVFGLVFWTSALFLVWIKLQTPRLLWENQVAILGMGAFAVGVAAVVLFYVAPMDEWWSYGAAPEGDLEPIPFLIVFLTSMPACALLVAALAGYITCKPVAPKSPIETSDTDHAMIS